MKEPWKYTIDERVRWGDVDAARIIFYGAYNRFFEFAETELFRAVGLPYNVMFDELDIWLPRVHLECDFHHAAQLDDLLEVSVYVGRFGNKSMRLNFEVRRKGDEEIIADACELVIATLCDQQRELLYAVAADELCLCHAAAFSCSALNLS